MLTALLYVALMLSVLGAVQVCAGLIVAADDPDDPQVPARLLTLVILTLAAYLAAAVLMLVSLLVTAVT